MKTKHLKSEDMIESSNMDDNRQVNLSKKSEIHEYPSAFLPLYFTSLLCDLCLSDQCKFLVSLSLTHIVHVSVHLSAAFTEYPRSEHRQSFI